MESIFNEQEPQEATEASNGNSGLASLNLSDTESQPKEENWTGHDFEPPLQPMTFAETVRNSGLAYAAGLTLFASVVFMLLLGWFVDLLAGTAPYGVVGGIVLGALIGFVQFFRLTSQIYRK